MPDLITLGETMVLLTPSFQGPLEEASLFLRSLGGAESNVAIGAARLGTSVGWVSRLGKDPFGSYILKRIRGEGVDTSRVQLDPSYPTAVMFKEIKAKGNPHVYFYRKGSAFSRIKPDDLDESYLSQARILHITGIAPALSQSSRETIYAAVEIARKHRVKISLDPNIRLKLWSIEEAREVLLDLASRCDYFLPGEEELKLLFSTTDRQEWVKRVRAMNLPCTVAKLGEEGCMVIDGNGCRAIPGFPVDQVVDTVGAGDGFAAGFLHAVIQGLSVDDAARIANAVGARCVTVMGDVEGLPTREELDQFMGRTAQIDR
jgi:2-dehydro-3-deoxygluconokinase